MLDPMSRPKIGDVMEIPTTKGLAYAQYTHQHTQFGGLIRVFDAIFESRPRDFSELVQGPVRFSTFFPVVAAIKRQIFKIVAHEKVAHHNQAFPVFRDGLEDPQTKKVAVWWFWDGQKEWRVGELTPQQRKMPLRGVWNDTMLISRIEKGWRPEMVE
jgi:hypothetical protein